MSELMVIWFWGMLFSFFVSGFLENSKNGSFWISIVLLFFTGFPYLVGRTMGKLLLDDTKEEKSG